MVAALTMASTNISTTAFTTTPLSLSFSSTTTIIRPRAMLASSRTTTLFAKENNDNIEEEKPSIETINDTNRHTLLHPPHSPSRPVLVDAMAPWCGPCKLLDKILKKSQPRYLDRVDFIRWNVNDKENTIELKELFLESGFTLTKLPSLLVFKDGKCLAMRAGMANEFQLDKFLEDSLPELERTFDEDGLKMVPLPLPEESMVTKVKEDSRAKKEDILRQMSNLSFKAEEDGTTSAAKAAVVVTTVQQEIEKVIKDETVTIEEGDCIDPVECWERVEKTFWQNRTVVPAMDGVMLPSRSYGSP
eukprot:CAMPEP_0201600230 /NCGR_PEP_ID=MMETSP0492-20130828/1382_1 /ASSEMBLY_ACC=CAM_ASM_000837 /TAXON_ID=420259 /ORGANISM="Thalassiosira gravida, Strain GMp14c1" /LENGTH=302 /DNA_ID=CAMNT_0048062953 /DNA_START=154 /DNA_END=1062 /DNA_ORIENTATION=-